MATSSISGTSSTTSTTAQQAVDQASLDSEAFLKLFLVELQHQDPTQPMDNAKMLEQTSQLATLQAQEQQQSAMEKITATLAQQAQYQAQFSILSAIGKTAVTSLNGLSHDGTTKDNKFEVYFDAPIKGGTLKITSTDGKSTYKEIDLAPYVGKSGYVQIKWDGTDKNNSMLKSGVYGVGGEYVDTSDNKKTVTMGTGKIESVKYTDGVPTLKMGSMYVTLDNLSEIK